MGTNEFQPSNFELVQRKQTQVGTSFSGVPLRVIKYSLILNSFYYS